MSAPKLDARRVILAGISEERLDLFLLLNEGAGYEVMGVLDTREKGESTRIAEILGVDVYETPDPEHVPTPDVFIYGDDSYRALAERLGLDADVIWSENDAWRALTEGAGLPAEVDEAVPEEPGDPLDLLAAPLPVPAVKRKKPPSGEAVSGDLDLLHAFARATTDLGTLYQFIVDRAVSMTGARAAGIVPDEPIRPRVFRDRRSVPTGEVPAFLRDSEADFDAHALGTPGSPGAGRLVIVGGHATNGALSAFLDAVTPALRSVAELEDHRRMRAWDELVGRVSRELETGQLDESLTEACRSIADSLGAAECVLLFRSRDGEVLRGYSSRGARIVTPAGSGLFGASRSESGSSRFVDDGGAWHYHVPFGTGDRTGALGLYQVEVMPGAVEAVQHQAVSLAAALAPHVPETAWSA